MNDAMLMHIIHTHTIKVKVNANSGQGNSNAKKKKICIKNGRKKQEKRQNLKKRD